MTRGASPQQLARARASKKEIAAQAEAERRALYDRLIADLGRPATGMEECAYEQISAKMIRSRRLRAQGRDDREETRAIAQLMRAAGIRQVKPAPAPKKSLAEQLREGEARSDSINGVAQ